MYIDAHGNWLLLLTVATILATFGPVESQTGKAHKVINVFLNGKKIVATNFGGKAEKGFSVVTLKLTDFCRNLNYEKTFERNKFCTSTHNVKLAQ